jgi:probable rRNA maturation factor
MASPRINFYSEEITFKLPQKTEIKNWLIKVSREEGSSIGEISFIFCSDSYLLKINREYLNHNSLTDIITFDNSEEVGSLEGDIYISIERVKENAEKYGVKFPEELKRVMVHGLLHLIGYSDKSPSAKAEMRKKEDTYLSLS